MNIFIWRHSKKFSSWSMFNEPHICRDNYMQAEIVVLAATREEALELVSREDRWNMEELNRIEPIIIPVTQSAVVTTFVEYL
jgi:hypothetical protein